MKTINVRLLVEDEADTQAIVEALRDAPLADNTDRALWGVIGAVELANDGFGHLVPGEVRVRPNFQWSGEPIGETFEERPRAPRPPTRRSRRRDDYPFLEG